MAQVYEIGFVPVSGVSWANGVGFSPADGVKVGGVQWGSEPPAGTTMTLNYDAIGGLSIWDEDDTFSDDPQNPEWAELSHSPHRQFVDTDGYTVGGTSYPRGTLQVENEYEVLLTGADGKTYTMVAVSGTYYSDPAAISTRTELGIIGVTFVGDWPPSDTTLTFQENKDMQSFPYASIKAPGEVPCFTAGTLIDCQHGPRPVEDLRVGDLVMTRDHGLQPIRWIGSRVLSAKMLHDRDNLRPVRIAAQALGPESPSADLLVSPQHRILVRSRIAQRMFGTDEVLVAAKHLLAVEGIEIAQDLDRVEYWHILFDRHEIVVANGAETESLYVGPGALRAVDAQARQEILTLFPELADDGHQPASARLLVAGRQGRKLSERHAQNGQPLMA